MSSCLIPILFFLRARENYMPFYEERGRQNPMVKRNILSLFIFVRATKRKGGRHNNTSLTIYILLSRTNTPAFKFF